MIKKKIPTFLLLTDEFSSTLSHTIELVEGTEVQSRSSSPGTYNYNLTTPYAVGLGAMYLFGKSGFITADVEFKDYSSASFSSSYDSTDPAFYDFVAENEQIDNLFKPAINYRVGAELRFNALRVF